MSSNNQHRALITKTTSLIAAGDIVGAESALSETRTSWFCHSAPKSAS